MGPREPSDFFLLLDVAATDCRLPNDGNLIEFLCPCVELVLMVLLHPIVIHTFLISSCIESMLVAIERRDLSLSPTENFNTLSCSCSTSSFPFVCRSWRRASRRRWWRSIQSNCDDVASAEWWRLCDVGRLLDVRLLIVARRVIWRIASVEKDLDNLFGIGDWWLFVVPEKQY